MSRMFLVLSLLLSQTVFGQLYLSGFVGAAGYNGDLNEKTFNQLKPSFGITAAHPFTRHINLRLGILQTSLEGSDASSGSAYLQQNRNLSFRTNLTELSLTGEYIIFDLNRKNWSPYAFGGLALFRFNPYTMDNGSKVYLQPLSTEGQGLAEYPGREPYSLTALSFPFGGGVKFVATNNILIGVEIGIRGTTTDYVDDISQSYVDGNLLQQQRGTQAFQLSYRADEVPGGIPAYPDNGYPLLGVERGGPQYKDWYYVGGVHVIFRLDNVKKSSANKKSYGCNPIY